MQVTRSSSPTGKMSYLENPARKEELSPEKLLSLIPIKETDTVLDFGAGTGYFTIPAAKAVKGKVYALDLDAEMLEFIKAKALEEGAPTSLRFMRMALNYHYRQNQSTW